MKSCPFCMKEDLQEEARRCPYCSSWLDGRERVHTSKLVLSMLSLSQVAAMMGWVLLIVFVLGIAGCVGFLLF